MLYGVEQAMREYVEALVGELDRVAQQLDRTGCGTDRRLLATRLTRVRNRLEREGKSAPPARVDALHRLAIVAEDRGWLEAGEAILLRKLAFRVAFYLRRDHHQSANGQASGQSSDRGPDEWSSPV